MQHAVSRPASACAPADRLLAKRQVKKETELRKEFRFIADNFRKGNYQADLMTGSENNERRIELTYKMQEGGTSAALALAEMKKGN